MERKGTKLGAAHSLHTPLLPLHWPFGMICIGEHLFPKLNFHFYAELPVATVEEIVQCADYMHDMVVIGCDVMTVMLILALIPSYC